ncbi:MAG TPA: glycosyltransferase family 4 protein [Chloroflexota bacterium]|nr:glycosyltransferase family 4 protein [Chloroflexota bacterium]
MPRILIVSNLFPPDIGGPATYVPKIATELAARGHAISVVGGAPPEYRPGGPHDQWPYPVARVSRARPLPQRLLLAAATVWRMAGAADVLYVQGLAGPEMLAVLVARLRRRPVALKIVGDNAWEYAIRKGLTDDGIDEFQHRPYGPRLRLVRALVHNYARLVDRLIVPSHYLRGIVAGWGVPPARVRVIRNALTTSLATPDDRATARRALQAELSLPGPLIVTSARLYPWKNLDFLIRLMPSLPSQSTLAIVGGGPERQRLEQEARAAGVAGRVHFTGSVSHDTVQQYLRAADVFVLNTRYEGLSHVLLEAMAAGAPVVASAVGGNPEVVQHGRNGLLVPLNDGPAIVAAVESLLAEANLAARLRAQAALDVQAYRWDELVERTATTLEELSASGRVPSPESRVPSQQPTRDSERSAGVKG